jgi:hypothetical protein
MRTTLNLDEDVLRAVRSLADERGESLGTVVSDLARKGLAPQRDLTYEGSFPVFMVREGAPVITPEMVDEAAEDE